MLFIDNFRLSMKVVDVDKDLIELHTRALLRSNARYPLVESSVNFASIPANLKCHISKEKP